MIRGSDKAIDSSLKVVYPYALFLQCYLFHRISDLIYQWLHLEVNIFYVLKELTSIF